MFHILQLKSVLSGHLSWHGARLSFLAMFLIALLKVKTVNLTEIATALNPKAKVSSNYRRLQRFFAWQVKLLRLDQRIFNLLDGATDR